VIDLVWLLLILGGVAAAAAEGRIAAVTEAVMTSAQLGVETVLGFVGIMVFWLGLSRIAEEAGLIQALARVMAPIFRPIFPSIPRDHPALGAILMNLSANMLGLGHAATPFGLKAMQELQKLNDTPDRATDAMCTFLALNTSSVTLIPATVIALRASAQSANPTEIVAPTLVATCISSAVALAADYLFRRLGRRFG